MYQRQEIVGYRSSFNQTLAHLRTGISSGIISMQASRLIFNWLRDPSYDNIFSAFALTTAISLIKHAQENFGAESLEKLYRDGIELLQWRRESNLRASLPNMCLFSSSKSVYVRHKNTIIDSALAGIILCKSLELLINEGVSMSNAPVLAAIISFLVLLFKDFDFRNIDSDAVIAPNVHF